MPSEASCNCSLKSTLVAIEQMQSTATHMPWAAYAYPKILELLKFTDFWG